MAETTTVEVPVHIVYTATVSEPLYSAIEHLHTGLGRLLTVLKIEVPTEETPDGPPAV